MLVLLVTKKMRDELSAFSGLALRAGFVIAGAKAQVLLARSAARLKPCPDTKQITFYDLTISYSSHGTRQGSPTGL